MAGRWKKLGLLLEAEEFTSSVSWADSFTQAPNAVVLEDRVRIYFTSRPRQESDGNFVSRGAYVDFATLTKGDIIGFSKNPIMELGGLGDFDEFGTYPISVAKSSNGDFVAYYGGWTRCESVPFDVSIGKATSDNGEIFVKSHRGPVLSGNANEPFVITSPKIRMMSGKWVLTYTAGERWILNEGRAEIIYKLRIAFSENGNDWSRLDRQIVEDKIGPDEAQASPDVIFRNGKYHMFFCYRDSTDFRRNLERSYRIGYAYSQNLIDWTRDDEKYPLERSSRGWDSEMVAYPNVFCYKGAVYMLYLGNEVGKYGFGLARLDGDLY
jgi:predicted GH43/DUF377 family glycosyl hydrolase